jgi:hypothetical protein
MIRHAGAGGKLCRTRGTAGWSPADSGREISLLLAVLMIMIAVAGTGSYGRSEDTGAISANDAVARVSEDPAVGAWVTAVKSQSPQNRAVIEVDSEDAAVYTAHAYEIVDDGRGQLHTATFGW